LQMKKKKICKLGIVWLT